MVNSGPETRNPGTRKPGPGTRDPTTDHQENYLGRTCFTNSLNRIGHTETPY